MKRTNLKKTSGLKTTKPINRWGQGTADYETWKHGVAIPFLLSQSPRQCYKCATSHNVDVGHILPRSTHPKLKMVLTNVRWECANLNRFGACQ